MRRGTLLVVGLLIALVLAGIASHYASSDPDGLSRVAQDKGFASTEKESAAADSPLAGYGTTGVDSSRLSGGIAGVIGVVTTFAVAGGVLLLLRRRSEDEHPSEIPSRQPSDSGAR
jgi:cobalt/nickel transport system permease protein/cobalt/nickel transport protein